MADELNDVNDFSIFDLNPGENPLTKEAPAAEAAPLATESQATSEVEPEKVQEVVTPEAKPEVKAVEPVVPKAEPKKLELTDDDLIPITVDGKVEHVRWGDYKGGVMRQADYTRKTTRVAERERQLDEAATTLQTRENKLIEIFSDKTKLDALARKLYGVGLGEAAAAPVPEPPKEPSADELVTHADVKKTREEVLSEAQKAAQKVVADELRRVEAEKAELAQQRFLSDLESVVEKTLDVILEEHKAALGDVPHVDLVIRKMAAEAKPKDFEETKQALLDAGKKLAEQFAQRSREQKKQEAVRREAANLTKGIESGGTPPGRERKSYDKDDGSTDWNALDADVLNFIQSKMR